MENENIMIQYAENHIQNKEKQNFDVKHEEHEEQDKTIKELEILKKLSGKILSNINTYLSK